MEKTVAIVYKTGVQRDTLERLLKGISPNIVVVPFSNGEDILRALVMGMKIDLIAFSGNLPNYGDGFILAALTVISSQGKTVVGFSRIDVLELSSPKSTVHFVSNYAPLTELRDAFKALLEMP